MRSQVFDTEKINEVAFRKNVYCNDGTDEFY